MRVVLVDPPWTFDGSIYFGCRSPHLPLELAYAAALLERAGHDAHVVPAQLDGLGLAELRSRVEELAPDLVVVTTAPSYLFWRCPPPELRVPLEALAALRGVPGARVAIGPHGSTTPAAALRKLAVDAIVLGEAEEVLVELASTPRDRWGEVASTATWRDGAPHVNGKPHTSELAALPALRWPRESVARHGHHHHRFDAPPTGPGAEVEASRGCPYHCTFCAKETHRDVYRKRPLDVLIDEVDGLLAQGVRYLYFVDEIFLPDRPLLEALVRRDVQFGVQLRIDNWSRPMLDLLGAAGCVSIEAGVESLTERGRSLLAKRCKMTTEQLTELLLHAKTRVAFVQANLLDAGTDDPADVAAWRRRLQDHGVWSNDPVPMFPYPGSPDYAQRWGRPDDLAWERAHAHYLARFAAFSDIQDGAPRPLRELEASARG